MRKIDFAITSDTENILKTHELRSVLGGTSSSDNNSDESSSQTDDEDESKNEDNRGASPLPILIPF